MTIPIWIAILITCFAAIVAFCLGCAWRVICESNDFADSVYEARFRQSNFYAPAPETMPEPEPKTLPIARKYQKLDRERRRNA
jgi:hypothetical protein